jgi:para-nitrobenzyl esterase
LPFGSFAPIVDGYVLPDDPNSIFKQKQQQDVPVMAGWVMGDAGLGSRQSKSATDYLKDASKTYGANAAEFLKLFPLGLR